MCLILYSLLRSYLKTLHRNSVKSTQCIYNKPHYIYNKWRQMRRQKRQKPTSPFRTKTHKNIFHILNKSLLTTVGEIEKGGFSAETKCSETWRFWQARRRSACDKWGVQLSYYYWCYTRERENSVYTHLMMLSIEVIVYMVYSYIVYLTWTRRSSCTTTERCVVLYFW